MQGRPKAWIVVVGALALLGGSRAAASEPLDPPAPHERALGWLAAHQNEDGSWPGKHTTAITGLACLAWLGHDAEPFQGE